MPIAFYGFGGGNDNLTGGSLADYLSRRRRRRRLLFGGDGNDTFSGGTGADTLDGGTGTNRFVVGMGESSYAGSGGPGTNTDAIYNFNAGTNNVINFGGQAAVDSVNYAELTTVYANFTAAANAANSTATASGTQVVYVFAADATNGYLFYNRDGAGSSLATTDDLIVLPGVTAAQFSAANIAGLVAPTITVPLAASTTSGQPAHLHRHRRRQPHAHHPLGHHRHQPRHGQQRHAHHTDGG